MDLIMVFTDLDNYHKIEFSIAEDKMVRLTCIGKDIANQVIIDVPLKKWDAICDFLLSQKKALEDAAPTR